MFDRLKRALVESFVGAIALGYLLAQAVLSFVNVFVAPLSVWSFRREYAGMLPTLKTPPVSLLREALTPAADCAAILLLWYLLVVWLYFKPLQADRPEESTKPQDAR